MSPPTVHRRLTDALAPASANEASGSGNREPLKLAVGAAVAAVALSFLATKTFGSRKPVSHQGHDARVCVDVQPKPGGVIVFNASVPVADVAKAWSATRKCALGQLQPGTQLLNVTSQQVLRKTPSSRLFGNGHDGGAVVTQDAKWAVGVARGVARVTLSAEVDDKAQRAAFHLVGSEERLFFFEQGDEKNKNAASQKATKPSPLATYSGFLGVQNGEVYMRGAASVGGKDMPRAARALAATFAAKVLRRQIKRSLTDIKAVADETSNASKHPHK